MKKLSALLIILVLVLSLAACGKKEEENKATGTPAPTKEATTPEPTEEVTEAPTAEPTEEVTPEPTEEVTPEPTEEVTPEPTEEVTPEPTEEVTPEPTEEVTPEPTETPEPTDTPAEDDIFTKSEGVMTYQEYVAAAVDTEVVVETFVQDKQSWWEDKATIYTQDNEGAYFVYEMACSQEDYEKLVPGQKIKITGFKGEWQGEVEIVDGTFELLEGNYVADPVDVTEYLGTENMINFQNQYVLFKGLTVAASQDADGNEAAFLYKWNGSGSEGDDLYFNVEYNGQTFTFTVESYLRGKETDVYQAVKSLNVGDKIDLIGYAYWYDTLNPHIIEIAAAEE